MNIKNIQKHHDWVKIWSAKGSIYFCYQMGKVWTKEKVVLNKSIYKQIIFVYKKGVIDCWVTKTDKDDLGNRLVSLMHQDDTYIVGVAKDLKFYANEIKKFIKTHEAKKINSVELKQFWDIVYSYYLPHISVKYIVDYVTSSELKKILSVLQKVRLATESVYRDIEDYIEQINNSINKKGEVVLICDKKENNIFVGKDIEKIKKILIPENKVNIITGQVAYKGKITGRVKIVLNPSKLGKSFTKGDILVTGMTRTEFLPLLKKSAGFITDSGGILSHAAISARELKKPCVIGTKVATKVLKDGDVVEVDANEGVIKLIKNF